MSDLPTVHIYTDGSSTGRVGPGGWGAILLYPHGDKRKELMGGHCETTNNQMELYAAIAALAALKRPCNVRLFTDSQYVQKGASLWLRGWVAQGWVNSFGKPVANREFWEYLVEVAAPHTIEWVWVRGHAGVALNEQADALAKAGMKAVLDESMPPTPLPSLASS